MNAKTTLPQLHSGLTPSLTPHLGPRWAWLSSVPGALVPPGRGALPSPGCPSAPGPSAHSLLRNHGSGGTQGLQLTMAEDQLTPSAKEKVPGVG